MNIVITGASRGIGFETALALANEGHTVIALSRNTAGLDALKEQATPTTGIIDTYAIDITTANESTLADLFGKYEVIDGLVNNAGILINKPFQSLDIEEWKLIFETNLFSVVKLTKYLLPQLQKSTLAHIINIGSMGGFQGSGKFHGLTAYSASKAALANLTECLAEELKAINVKVNCLALGSVNTEMLKAAFPDYLAPVSSNEMGEFIANFLLRNHKFFNGKVLPVSVATP